MSDYNQLCVWEGTLLEGATPEQFEKDMFDVFGVRVKFVEEVITLPCENRGEEGGRHDLLFYIHDEDVKQFAIPRLVAGIRWWEDVFYNKQEYRYSKEILDKYPAKW